MEIYKGRKSSIERDIEARRAEATEVEKGIRHLENTFAKIAASDEIKLENYAPAWIDFGKMSKREKVSELKYWCF